ncbi:amino acid ABC transporter substrate-binding protein [Weissella confusa]|uniref:amino acid ABC transporter substrate-binding protein n=1 Tax=Weissella confusa TaxID=1583 RepID=UPI001899FC52|nr:amino acid ABC transporter substrate-binding protein [Weissella confusa]QYU57288.1 amino acid ABC transporter substrate-binding protein [Weissella confusa]
MKKKINWRRQIFGNGIVLAVLALLVGFVWYRTTHAQDTWRQMTADKTVVVGLDDTYVPMGFRDKSGKLVGYDVDLARATFKKLGLKVKFQAIDWSMKETELDTGHIDMIWNGYTITPARAKKVAFSVPYHNDSQVLVTMQRDHINTIKDMAGKTLAAQTGSAGLTLFNDKPKVLKSFLGSAPVQYDTFDKALNDLQVGRVNAVLIDSDYARYYVAHESSPAEFKVIKTGYGQDAYGIGFRKGDVTLREKVNGVINEFKKDGTLDKISERYFGTKNAD